jgi:hypothetical protein
MGIQNADDALRAIVNALDDLPPVLRETLKNKKRQEIEESFFSSYFDRNPEYRIEVPTPTIGNNAEYARALAKDKAAKQKILEQTRAKIQAEAGEAANRRFVELGYSEDLPNARDLAKDLYHEEILNSPLPYTSSRWQPTIYQDEIPQIQVRPQSTPQEVPGTVATIPTNNGAIAPEVLSEVLSTQPQYEGKSSVETAPPSGVNPLADGYQSGTSSGVPMTGSNVPPSKPPGGGNYNFEGGEFNSPDAQPQTGNYWQNLWDGTTKGFQYAVDAGKYEGRTASAAWNRAPESQYAYLQDEGKFGFGVGRVAGDVIGNGSRQVLWNIHPADLLGTYGPKILGEDASRMAKVVVPFAAVTGLELGSQVYNPFNLAEGGRVAGYQAINPDEDDPRISTTPVSELLIDRGFLGKRGRLLPWEQFRQERTDIPYEQYEKYQNYLRNKDENALRDMTGGLLKGTLDGINGPELSVMGYSVTPTGALAAGAALLAGRELVRTAKVPGFRK